MNTTHKLRILKPKADLEAALPLKVRFWLSDAQANGADVGDVGGELIDALTGRFHWDPAVAIGHVNALLALYGSEQTYGRRSR